MSFFGRNRTNSAQAELDAFSRSQAIIEFTPEGTIVRANALFLQLMGYTLDEIVGKHHSIFVDQREVNRPEYRQFWAELAAGKSRTAEFRRLTKSGTPVYIQGSYNPVIENGVVTRVVKIASDVTAQKNQAADAQGQLAAISKAQAIIEFGLDGTVLTANENFCKALGYTLAEIKGRHHSLFVEPDYAASPDYASFWSKLRQGEYQAAEYKRIGKGGRAVWIQASYNPIFDLEGRPYKVVKYATDITGVKDAVNRIGASLADLAEGNLGCEISEALPGDLDTVRRALNTTIERLTHIVTGLQENASSLRSATAEILQGTNDLADRTTKQAAAVEETSAAMEQLAQTVSENTRRAQVARQSSAQISVTASNAGNVIRQANDAMGRIASSSDKISNIIGMIDDIAFQTNLLALNASVEAARAGDAGKGFAVVAVEVRRLAQSAANASADVKSLVQQSADEVSVGTRLVGEATEQVTQVVSGIGQSASLVEEMAQATQSQSIAISEVTNAIRQMDEMTQHNAALVEETNAAIEQTEGQAAELDQIVEQFTLPDSMRRGGMNKAPQKRSGAPVSTGRPAARRGFGTAGNAALKAEWSEF